MQCASPGCLNKASLLCPTCIKLQIESDKSSFCSQICFKAAWPLHKTIHNSYSEEKIENNSLSKEQRDHIQKFKGFAYSGKLRAFPLTPPRLVPDSIPKPDYHSSGVPLSEQQNRGAGIKILSKDEIQGMRKVCRLAREVLDIAAKAVAPGVTTDEIDRIVHQACIDRNSYPSPLNYYNFPKSCCTSINEVICHGIPDTRPMEEGDIVNIDITLYHNGYHGDLNETYIVGDPAVASQEAKDLIKTAYDSMHAAIKQVCPGALFRDFGKYIERVATSNNCSVVRTYCGHGINQLFHTAPNIPHYKKNKAKGLCKPGMVFTIEPMINRGTYRDLTWPDNWTAVTEDGQLSAQFEHTMLVTETGVEILTARLDTSPKFWWEI